MERPRLGVSSCLLGSPVRFDGGHKRFRFLTDELGPYVDWVPYCPEVEIGLGTPREPIRLTDSGRLVNRSGTLDHTGLMDALPLPVGVGVGVGGLSGFDGPSGLDGYVFKAKSPSCGVWGIPRYRASGEASGAYGAGLYAGRVVAAAPLLAVEDEGRLNDAGLREAFVERVFAAARLRALLSGARGVASGARDLASGARGLVEFHARHKLQLLAHDPARYRLAGRVVATGGGTAASAAAEYRELFLAAMATPATRGRNANALLHAYSRIGRTLSGPRRSDLVGRIDAYRRGEVPLSVPVALLAHYASGGDLPWLESQTFLAPYPAELRLRHAV